MRVALCGALALQLFALYVYEPGDGGQLVIPHFDKIVHAVIFMIPAALGVLARFPASLVGIVLAVHAPASELVQHVWLPTRAADPWDVIADWAGLVLGLIAARLVLRPRPAIPD